MHNLAATVLLAEQKRCQCPCGAVAERRSGLCRKCRDRNAWRRKAATPRRKATRRRFGRRTRTNLRLHAESTIGMKG
jgi:hypothetical protein